jgi:hypothetical protein
MKIVTSVSRWRAAFGNAGLSAAHQITAAILRDHLGCVGALGLKTCRVADVDFGNDIGRRRTPHAMVWTMPPSARSAAPLVADDSLEAT